MVSSEKFMTTASTSNLVFQERERGRSVKPAKCKLTVYMTVNKQLVYISFYTESKLTWQDHCYFGSEKLLLLNFIVLSLTLKISCNQGKLMFFSINNIF